MTEHAENRFIVNVYNSLGKFINKYLRIPVSPDFDKFRVIDSDGNIAIDDICITTMIVDFF